MRNSDIITIPSIGEGFGLVFLEAYLAKKPVVAFDVSASNEIVIDDITGALVPLQDIEEYANALLKLLKNPEIRKKQGEAGRALLNDYFSFERDELETLNFYKNILLYD
jgi:glycosyltransferase involved in cell wall biosynthesis